MKNRYNAESISRNKAATIRTISKEKEISEKKSNIINITGNDMLRIIIPQAISIPHLSK